MRKRDDGPGRGLFYTRDSEGRSENAPPQYAAWAVRRAASMGVTIDGSAERMAAMIASRRSVDGDMYLDYGISGNLLSRPGLDAFRDRALRDLDVTHLFVPRRDRLARPDDPLEAAKLEMELRAAGLRIVLTEGEYGPIRAGDRAGITDLMIPVMEYYISGNFRRELAEKVLRGKVGVAAKGRSIGGTPLYGFRRWLVNDEGPVRELAPGEWVKMVGHGVAWLPTAEHELEVVRRIVTMFADTPAARIARVLNSEGIPSPNAGRSLGGRGPTSGVWAQNTVKAIATHPLLAGIACVGRRGSGDQMRMTPEGPRPLSHDDFGTDGRPRTLANPAGVIRATASFEPIMAIEAHQQLLEVAESRGRHLKGKSRTREGRANALAGRIFDMNCGWLMYRHERGESRPSARGRWNYQCGLYQNSQTAACSRHVVEGPRTTAFVLSALRQRVLRPDLMARLRERIRELAAATAADAPTARKREAIAAELAAAQKDLERAGRNLALAESPDQFRAITRVHDELHARAEALKGKLSALPESRSSPDPESEIEAAMAELERLRESTITADDHEAAARLFRTVDARLYLRFAKVRSGKGTVNAAVGGILTFGDQPPPVPLYDGPTSRAIIRERIQKGLPVTAGPIEAVSHESEPGGNGSANVQRLTTKLSGPGRRPAASA